MEWTPEAIKSFKERHGLTAESMAAMLGCNRSYVFLLMKGERQPSDIICRLLDCLDSKATVGDGEPKYEGTPSANLRGCAPDGCTFTWQFMTIALSQISRIQPTDPGALEALEEIKAYTNTRIELASKSRRKKK